MKTGARSMSFGNLFLNAPQVGWFMNSLQLNRADYKWFYHESENALQKKGKKNQQNRD